MSARDSHSNIESASELHDDLMILRAAAGVALSGPLDIPALQRSIRDCCRGVLEDCPSCTALATVLDRECAPEDREREPHESEAPISQWGRNDAKV